MRPVSSPPPSPCQAASGEGHIWSLLDIPFHLCLGWRELPSLSKVDLMLLADPRASEGRAAEVGAGRRMQPVYWYAVLLLQPALYLVSCSSQTSLAVRLARVGLGWGQARTRQREASCSSRLLQSSRVAPASTPPT